MKNSIYLKSNLLIPRLDILHGLLLPLLLWARFVLFHLLCHQIFELGNFLLVPADPDSLKSVQIDVFPHSSLSDSDHGGDVFDAYLKLVEGLDCFFDLTSDLVLPFPHPAKVEGLDFADFLSPKVIEVIPPLRLEQVDDLDPMIEFHFIAAEGHQTQALLFCKQFRESLKVLLLVDLFITDGDEGHTLVEELGGHQLHVQLSLCPRVVVEAEVRWVLLYLSIVILPLLKQRDVWTDIKVMVHGKLELIVDSFEDWMRGHRDVVGNSLLVIFLFSFLLAFDDGIA